MADDPARRYLDEPYLAVAVDLETVAALMQVWSRTESPLPSRLRTLCAGIVLQANRLRRELARHPDRLMAERAREERRT